MIRFLNLDFLFVVIGSSGIPFYKRLGVELRRRGYSVCYVTGVRARSSYDLRDIRRGLSGDGFYFIDMAERIRKIRERGVDIDSEVRRIKRQYGIRSFRSIYFPEMAHTYNEDIKDDRRFVELTVYTFIAAEALFKHNNVKCVIQYPGPELLRRILYNVARLNNILSVWMAWSPVPGCVLFYSNEMKVLDDVKGKDYSELSPKEIDEAENFVSRFRATKGRMVLHVEKKKRRQRLKSRYLGIIPKYGKLDLVLPRVYDCYDMSFLRGFLSFIRYFLLKRLKTLRKLFYYALVYPSQEESKRLIREGNYLFFPLQYPRESRVTLRAPQFFRQEKFVRLVAKSLPDGLKLYVKDHPGLVGELSYRTIRGISKTKNAVWLNPNIRAYDAIMNSLAVITINNTPGFEAIIYGKPVITVGKASYGGYGVTTDVEDYSPENIRRCILKAIERGVSDEKLIPFVSEMLKASHPGSFYDTDEHNIAKMADYIIDFIERHSGDFNKNPRIKKALSRVYIV